MDKLTELNQFRNRIFIANIIAGSMIAIGFLSFMASPGLGMMLFVGGGIALIVIQCTLGKQYRIKFKEYICKDVIESIFEVEAYDPDHGFSEEFVESTYFVPHGNRFSSDDYLRGSYHGCTFERSDVCVQEEHSDGKNTTTDTLFQGSWTVFSFPKKVSSYLVLRERGYGYGKPGGGGWFSTAPKTSKVTFEDVEFNKRFDVYAEDEHDAFYVLTPAFMQKIKTIEQANEGGMILGIIDQKVHILFHTNENALEPPIVGKITDQTTESIREELFQIVDLIDALDLIEKEV